MINKYCLVFLMFFSIGVSAEKQFGTMLLEDAEVNLYKDNLENIAIAEELQFYDFDYVLDRLPTLQNLISSGVQPMAGDIARTRDKPVYRVALFLKGDENEEDIKKFKNELQSKITVLAKEHVADQELCWNVGRQLGKKLKKIIEKSPRESWNEVHPVMKNGQTIESYDAYITQTREKGYIIKKQEYIYCQSYRNHPSHKRDILVLHYGVDYKSKNESGKLKGEMQITAMREGLGWNIAGYRFW